MSKKTKHSAAPRHTTQPRDIDRWLDRAAQQLVAADYPGVVATAWRVLRAPIASTEQRAEAYDRLGAAHMMLQRTITRKFAGAIMSGVQVFGRWQTIALMEH